MNNRFYVGIHCTSSKGIAVVARANGEGLKLCLIERSFNPLEIEYGRFSVNINLLRQILEKEAGISRIGKHNCAQVCFALPHMRFEFHRQVIRQLLLSQHDWVPEGFLIVSDSQAALTGGVCNEGLVLVSGSGAGAYAQLSTGEMIHIGEWGSLFGAKGSGYAIGIKALDAIAAAHDGTGPACPNLVRCVMEQEGLHRVDALANWIHKSLPRRNAVSGLASSVVKAAEETGDPIAKNILKETADDLVTYIDAVLAQLPREAVDGRLAVMFEGGVLENCLFIQKHLCAEIQARMRPLTIQLTEFRPVIGSLFMSIAGEMQLPAETFIQSTREAISQLPESQQAYLRSGILTVCN